MGPRRRAATPASERDLCVRYGNSLPGGFLLNEKAEFAGVQRLLLPMHSIIRIEEVESRGQNKILDIDGKVTNVTPFPLPPTDGRSS